MSTENNKLIAEFMGVEEAYNPNGNDWVLKTTTPDAYGDTDILESCKDNELQYHSSWDWLMPVVEKIEGLRDSKGDAYRFSIDMCNAQIETSWDWGTNIEILGGSFKLDTTYKAVVEFIKKRSEAIINRLEFWDGGDGVDFEYWRDTKTEFVYQVPIEIVRDFNEIKKVNIG